MFKTVRGRIIAIIITVSVAGWQLYTNDLKLGLDLQGGMHLALEVDDPDGTMTLDAKEDMIDRVDRIIRTRIDELGVEEPLIQKVGRDRLIVELAGISDEDQAKWISKSTILADPEQQEDEGAKDDQGDEQSDSDKSDEERKEENP